MSAAGGRGANEFYGFEDDSEEHTRRYRQFAQRIHSHGALALVELCHVGQAKSEIEGDEQPIGPMGPGQRGRRFRPRHDRGGCGAAVRRLCEGDEVLPERGL